MEALNLPTYDGTGSVFISGSCSLRYLWVGKISVYLKIMLTSY